MSPKSPLVVVCERNDLEGVRRILDSLKPHDEFVSADRMAEQADIFVKTVQYGYFEIIKLFVEENAVSSYAKSRALTTAIKFDQFEIMKYLVELDFLQSVPVADIALVDASKFGKLEMAKYLVEEANADISYRHYSAKRVAIAEGHVNVVKYLDSLQVVDAM